MTREVETSKHRCLRCGSPLLYDGNRYWCSFVGGGREKACAFGIDKPVGDLALGVMLARGAEKPPVPMRTL